MENILNLIFAIVIGGIASYNLFLIVPKFKTKIKEHYKTASTFLNNVMPFLFIVVCILNSGDNSCLYNFNFINFFILLSTILTIVAEFLDVLIVRVVDENSN